MEGLVFRVTTHGPSAALRQQCTTALSVKADFILSSYRLYLEAETPAGSWIL